MDRDRFRRLVRNAVRELPPGLSDYLDNIAIVVRREPTEADRREAGVDGGADLFGLYLGVPLTRRGDYHMTLPDQIVIFQGPLERHYHPHELPREIRRTVRHEIAHHFGIDDDELDRIGLG